VTEIDIKTDQCTEVDRDLITMFLRMSPEERILTNDNSIRAILDLRNAFEKKETTIEPKCDSKDPSDRQRLPILEETLRQIRESNNKQRQIILQISRESFPIQ